MSKHQKKSTGERKRRRPRGSGSIYRKGRVFWISYQGPDGLRHAESSESTRKGDAERLLQRRVGARENNLPVIPRAERLTFNDAAKAVIEDFKANNKRSLAVVERRIQKHLTPYFGGYRLAGITAAHVTAYIAHRQEQGIVREKAVPVGDGTDQTERKTVRVADVSNAEINRELQILKRTFSLAIKSGRIAMRPHIPLLREDNVRAGFFEPEQLADVLSHLPTAIRPIIRFAAITGWRIKSEVLPLEWRQVDFKAGEVRLDAGTTKNGEGRVFPMTRDLRVLLESLHTEHEKRKKAGQIVPWVFVRMVAKGRGGDKSPKQITAFSKAWKGACCAVGCPGRIPHDLRRTAVRNLVRASIPERVAMQMTGHKTRSVFERYNIVSDGDLRDAARKLDSFALPASSAAGR
jgi:integrase